MEVARKIGGTDHGFRFIQVPISVLMPEALVENWQQVNDQYKPLVSVANLLHMNVMVSKPILEGKVRDIKIEGMDEITDPVSRHLQLVRSMPPRCIISTMVGMKKASNVNSNF